MPGTRLRPDAKSVAAARRFVADVLFSGGFAEACIERAVLLTSELVSSAVARADNAVDIEVVADHPMVRVKVRHDGETPELDLEADSAYRLQLISALSEAWGVEATNGQPQFTWFEVRS